LLLFGAVLLLFRKSTEDALVGSWTIDPESAQESYPLQVAQTGMALDFHRDGTFLLHFADETTTGKWRITRKEGDKVTVTLAIPGQPPGECSLQDSNGMRSTLPGLGTFALTRYDPGDSGQNPRLAGANFGNGNRPVGELGGSRNVVVPGIQSPVRPSVAPNTAAPLIGSNSANYSLIVEHLYMGGAVSQPPPATRATLNLSQAYDSWRTEVYNWKPIPDAAPAPSLDWLQQQVDFVSSNRGSGKVTYVHCAGGKSRSGLVTVAYVMAEYHWSRDGALSYVRSRRPQTNPNAAFLDLLSKWEQHLGTRWNGAGNAGRPDFALDDDDDDEDDVLFAQADLRDFLASNLAGMEP
jgi:hypothetical protein